MDRNNQYQVYSYSVNFDNKFEDHMKIQFSAQFFSSPNCRLFSVLISKLQELMEEWRKRHSYEVNVRGLRIRRRRRAVTVSGFLDQCCQSGCRLSDLVSVGFC